MPQVDPVNESSQIFWSAEDILDAVRVLVNDVQGDTLAGQNLSNDRPYTWKLLNFCYARLQNALEDTNVETATYAETRIVVPASQRYSDPAAESRLDYTGFTDAQGNFSESPVLPGNLLQPLSVSERPSSISMPFRDMRQIGGEFPAGWSSGSQFFGAWKFEQNALILRGGTLQDTELRINYIPSMPELIQPTGTNPYPNINFGRAGEALAYMIAAEYAEIRSAPNAAMLRAKADREIEIISNKSAKRAANVGRRMRGYSFGRRRRLWL